jgi:hypothetical protein
MTFNVQFRAAIFAACMTLMMAGAAHAQAVQEIPLATGEHWMKSSEDVKKAYLIGMANIMSVESAYEGSTPVSDAQGLIPREIKGLKGHTLDSVREGLNKWYAAHPDQLQRPVVETIWFEMVVPGLKNPK